MNLDIQARGFTLTEALAAAVRRETRGLPADEVRRLQVRLFDINGLRGGLDKGCLVALYIKGAQRVVIASGLDSDLYRAIPAAFDKLRRAMKASARRACDMRRSREHRPAN